MWIVSDASSNPYVDKHGRIVYPKNGEINT